MPCIRMEYWDTRAPLTTKREPRTPTRPHFPLILPRRAMRTKAGFRGILPRFGCISTTRFWGEPQPADSLGIAMFGSLRRIDGGSTLPILGTETGSKEWSRLARLILYFWGVC